MATAQVETVTSTADKLKLVLALGLAVLAVVAYYLLAGHSAWIRWAALLVGLALAVGAFLSAEPGRQLIAFGRDSVREVKKVVWPGRQETLQMTLYVFAFVVVMSLFLWLADKTLEWLLYGVILGWR
ncbi:MAG: preprotein translocase subunit SecE [Comamonas sp.]